MDLHERARGALIGQLVGDALGTTVEFSAASAIAWKYPQGHRDIVGGDSELALALARGIVARGNFEPDEVAQRYLAWYASGPFDIGNTTRQAFGQWDDGDAVAERVAARASIASQANGSLMRVSPLGIFGHGLPEADLAIFAAIDSRLSHPHPVCVAACAVFVHAIAYAVRTGSGAGAVFEEACKFAGRCDLAAPIRDSLMTAAEKRPDDFETNEGWVRIAFENAFFELAHVDSFEEALVRTVNAGGDTDTNGAIAGALLGAVVGEASIPERWRRVVLGCRTSRGSDYQTTDARELAEALVQAGSKSTRAPS